MMCQWLAKPVSNGLINFSFFAPILLLLLDSEIFGDFLISHRKRIKVLQKKIAAQLLFVVRLMVEGLF